MIFTNILYISFFFHVSQNLRKMGKICSIFDLHQSFLAILKVSYRKKLQDMISAHKIVCDLKKIAKKGKLDHCVNFFIYCTVYIIAP